jgi:hypothetical protein
MGNSILRTVFSGPILRRSLVVALVVGTILNTINQGDAFLVGELNVLKVMLTYTVPFFVASYGAYGAISSGLSKG